MTSADCREKWAETIESARSGHTLDAELAGHLMRCSSCRTRWREQRRLSADLHRLREAADRRVRPVAHREELLDLLAAQRRRRLRHNALWMLAAAAVVLLAIAIGFTWRGLSPAARQTFTATTAVDNVSVDNVSLDDEFVDVPYAPPLAQGELVRVVRAELDPAALVRMGLDTGGLSNDITADLIVGEDGVPRAVRIEGF